MTNEIKGYPINSGYIGYVDGRKMLFETEEAYKEYVEYSKENEDEAKKKENEY